MNIKLVADSSANLHTVPLQNVSYVPLKIIVGEQEYTDDETLHVPKLLSALRSCKGKTGSACPGVQQWLDAFEGADLVFAISITSALSGCYNSARLAAEEYRAAHPQARVFVMDSYTTGPEMQLILEKCQQLIDDGLTFEEICAGLEDYCRHTHLLFSLESLDNFAKNGRVSALTAKAVGLLGIRIVGRASAQGTLEPMHKCRGEKRALAQLMQSLKQEGFCGGKVRITHTRNPAAADVLSQMIRAEYPECDITVSQNRGLCSYYAEEGGILVGFEG